MMKYHEYDLETDSGLLIEPSVPVEGRVTLSYEGEGESVTFQMPEEMFAKVAEKFLAERKKTRPVAASAGSRASRSTESRLVDF